MKSKLQVYHPLFQPGFTSEYEMSCQLEPYSVSVLTDMIVNELLPEESLREELLTDLKGRDAQLPAEENIPPDWLPIGEEIFFAAGKIFPEDDPVGQKALADDFVVRLSSSFSSFQGEHHIVHSTQLFRSSVLPPFVRMNQLGRAFPMQISAVRMGLEMFESRRTLVSAGFSPVATQTLLLECYGDRAFLKITAEGLKEKYGLPLLRNGMLERLDAVTQRLCGTAVSADYAAHLQEK